MNNRIVSIVVFAFLIVSCRQLNLVLKEDFATNTTSKWYFTDKSNRYLNLILEKDSLLVIFDTGGGDILTVTNPKFEIDPKRVIKKERKLGDALSNNKKYISYSINFAQSPLFDASNMNILVGYKPVESFRCDSVLSTYGILGTNFYSYKQNLLIDYSSGFLQFLENKNQYEGFFEADAKFNTWTGKIFIKLFINGVSDYFLFDTGNLTELQIDSSFQAKANLGLSTHIEAFTFGANSSYVSTKKEIYTNKKIRFIKGDALSENTSSISYSNTLNANILNLHLIKKYNWILDYTNKKLYFQPYEKNRNRNVDFNKKNKTKG